MNQPASLIVAAVACLAAPLAHAGDHHHHGYTAAWGPAPYYQPPPRSRATRVRVVETHPVRQRVRYEVPVHKCRNGHCRVRRHVRYDERIVGYRVSWVHHGHHGVVELPHLPGPYITVAFDIRGPR
jgi:uncharacterized protein YcfJ